MAIRKKRRNLKQYRRFKGRALNRSSLFDGKYAGIIFVGCCFMAFLFFSYQALARSSVFYATNLTIDGCQRLNKKKIMELGGIDIHSNLLTVDPEQLQNKLEGHAWIKKAEVIKQLPDTLAVHIRERKPAAMITLANSLHYIDDTGVIFTKVLPDDDHDFPVITGLEQKHINNDEVQAMLAEALQFIHYASKGDSRLPKQNISELNVDDNANITIFLVDRPFPIYLGRKEMKEKYNRLARVLYKLYKKEFFDETAYIKMNYTDYKVLVGRADG